MFQKTKNIDTAFRHIKAFSIVLVIGCILQNAFVLYKSYELSARVQDKIYILSGDKVMEAYTAKRKDNIEVEARSHIEMFHIDFFTLDPGENVIEANFKKALKQGLARHISVYIWLYYSNGT